MRQAISIMERISSSKACLLVKHAYCIERVYKMADKKNKVGRPLGVRKKKICLAIEEAFYERLKLLAEQEYRSIAGQIVQLALMGEEKYRQQRVEAISN